MDTRIERKVDLRPNPRRWRVGVGKENMETPRKLLEVISEPLISSKDG